MGEFLKIGFAWIGMFHVFFMIFGALDLCHYRLYIGMEDTVIVSKAEYEELKALRGDQ
ncbi:hypothetical protein [Acinetobacter haemolyticus]|uniref:hypothetical protein n=1 Tax=Acinetobacter haemolyticus TaxID=29430 RepID=UPI00135B2B5D|nr:hypothetical protein [Acinetobacter haemolyticus]